MILLNHEEPSFFRIDKDLVKRYKREGDLCLISIRHEMTKQLVSYKVYFDLQKINNMFYRIIKGLYRSEYDNISQFQNDYSEFEKRCKTYIKNCNGELPELVHDSIMKDINSLQLLMQKLKTICIDFCQQEENSK